MKTMRNIGGIGMFLSLTTAAWAGEANTWAQVGSTGRGPGTAAAGAEYHGDGVGFTQTQARTGTVNYSRGTAWGFDEDGLDLSTSYAVAPQRGPAVAGTFNLHIGLDGEVTTSAGRTVASGDPVRSVTAGGWAGDTRGSATADGDHQAAPTGATASGHTGPRGTVTAETRTDSRPTAPRLVVTSPRPTDDTARRSNPVRPGDPVRRIARASSGAAYEHR